jgi:hypothetical protein
MPPLGRGALRTKITMSREVLTLGRNRRLTGRTLTRLSQNKRVIRKDKAVADLKWSTREILIYDISDQGVD